MYLSSILLKISIASPPMQCRVWIQLISQHQTVIRDLNSQNRNATWISKWDKNWNYWVLFKDFGFALDLSDIDLWNIDLVDTYTFRFTRYRCLQFFVSNMSWKCLQDMSSGRLQDMSFRCLQHNSFSSPKTSSRRLCKMSSRDAEDVFKTSSRLPNVFWGGGGGGGGG